MDEMKGDGGPCDTDTEYDTLQHNYEFLKRFLHEMKERTEREIEPKFKDLTDLIDQEIEEYVAHRRKARGEKPIESDESKKQIETNGKKVKTYFTSSETETQEKGGVRVKKYRKTRRESWEQDKPVIDTRILPELEVYDEDAGMDFLEYLAIFETYHAENYRGGRYLWIKQLEKHLSGRLLEGFRIIRRAGDSYDVVRQKLVEWYEGEVETRKKEAKERFKNATIEDRESLFAYSNRLSILFTVAYPKKDVEHSHTLINQFLRSISASAKEVVESQILNYQMWNKIVVWKDIQKCAKLYDARRKQDKEEVITINLGQAKNEKVAVESSQWMDRGLPERKAYYNPTRGRGYDRQRYNNRGRNNFTRAPSMNMAQTCKFCKRFGHEIRNCRKRLGTCFTCGKKGHQMKDCFSRRRGEQGRNRSLSPMKKTEKSEKKQRSYSCTPEENKEEKDLNC